MAVSCPALRAAAARRRYAGVRPPFSWTRQHGVEMKSRAAPDNAFSGPVSLSLQYCNTTRFLEGGDPPCRVRATTEYVHTSTLRGANPNPALGRNLVSPIIEPGSAPNLLFRPGPGPCKVRPVVAAPGGPGDLPRTASSDELGYTRCVMRRAGILTEIAIPRLHGR